jgi:hypothetical protein
MFESLPGMCLSGSKKIRFEGCAESMLEESGRLSNGGSIEWRGPSKNKKLL